MITKFKPGKVPEGTIPLIDVRGNVRGHCTKAAIQSTINRFPGMGRNAKLVTMAGSRKEWHAQPRKA